MYHSIIYIYISSESPKPTESISFSREAIVNFLKETKLSKESDVALFRQWVISKQHEYNKNKGQFDSINLELDIAEVFYDAGMFDQAEEYRAQAEEIISTEQKYFLDNCKELPPELKDCLHRYELLRWRLAEVAE